MTGAPHVRKRINNASAAASLSSRCVQKDGEILFQVGRLPNLSKKVVARAIKDGWTQLRAVDNTWGPLTSATTLKRTHGGRREPRAAPLALVAPVGVAPTASSGVAPAASSGVAPAASSGAQQQRGAQQQQHGTLEIRAHVINLPRSVARLEHAKTVMASLQLSVEIFVAIDGNDMISTTTKQQGRFHEGILSATAQQTLGTRAVPCRATREATVPGVAGCAWTHLRLWQKCFASAEQFHHIFEDDVAVAPGFTPEGAKCCIDDAMRKLIASGHHWDVLLLGMLQSPATVANLKLAVPIVTVGDLSIVPISNFWGSHAMTLQCRRKILPTALEQYLRAGFAIDNALSKAARDGALSVLCFARASADGLQAASIFQQMSTTQLPSTIRSCEPRGSRERQPKFVATRKRSRANALLA